MIAIGVDIGGTGIKSALVDTVRGELVSERLRTLTAGGAPGHIAAALAEQLAQLGSDGPIGIGFPGVVKNGVVFTSAHVDDEWQGMDFRAAMREAAGRDVVVLNDADAAALAEARFGVAKDVPGVVLRLTLGTGIGSAMFVDGVLVPNLELGHIEVRGKEGELRAAASVRDRKKLTWEQWAERLNEYLDHVDRLVWPDLIVLGGGVTKNADRFLHLLRARPPIEVARLQNQAGIVGAAMRAAEGLSH
ncbi:MAG: ROK family protein [Thermoleophilia bacterium]